MRLFELHDAIETKSALYDPALDVVNTRHTSDTRKSKLFLTHINKLKKMRELKKLQNIKREDLMSIMYGGGGEVSGGSSPF